MKTILDVISYLAMEDAEVEACIGPIDHLNPEVVTEEYTTPDGWTRYHLEGDGCDYYLLDGPTGRQVDTNRPDDWE